MPHPVQPPDLFAFLQRREQRIGRPALDELELGFLADTHVGMGQQSGQLSERPLGKALGQQLLDFENVCGLGLFRIANLENAALACLRPAGDPVAEIKATVRGEIAVGGEHVGEELFCLAIDFERRPARFDLEGEYRAAVGVAAEIAQEEVLFVALGNLTDAGIVSEPGRSRGDVGAGRDDACRLLGEWHSPDFLGVPRAQPSRVVHFLIADPPTAISAWDDIHPPGRIAAVGVVVAGEEVAILVESQLLGIAEPVMEDLEVGPIRIAPKHGAGVGIVEHSTSSFNVEPAIAAAEIDPAVGPHFEAVQVVAGVAGVNAETIGQRLSGVGFVLALGVVEQPKVGNAGEPHAPFAREHAGRDAAGGRVETVGEDHRLIVIAVAFGIGQKANAFVVPSVGVEILEVFLVHGHAILDGAASQLGFEPAFGLQVAAVVDNAAVEPERLDDIDSALFVEAEANGVGDHRLGGDQAGLGPDGQSNAFECFHRLAGRPRDFGLVGLLCGRCDEERGCEKGRQDNAIRHEKRTSGSENRAKSGRANMYDNRQMPRILVFDGAFAVGVMAVGERVR
jgi:hypothetical protein